jgi:cobyrinic acid a,c-diamide synthase
MAGDRGAAILIAGTGSNSGKTTITLGLLAALRKLGLAVQPFKCGPDFIDPGLHRLACGQVSRNLDLWMMGEPQVRETFAKGQKSSLPPGGGGLGRGGTSDEIGRLQLHPPPSPLPSREGEPISIAVIEGVMGMFDGQTSSSAALAKVLGVPVVLILDVRSAAESVAAVLKGFETLLPEVAPVAVILNRVASPRHLELVSGAIRQHCRAEILGHLPQSLDFAMPARHLGLFTGEEQPISPEALDRLAATITAQVNLKRLLELAAGAGSSAEVVPASQEQAAVQARIGVARDRAFCFYYEDNFDLLRAAGAELVFFSPLVDQELPAGLDGLYLGGGYPELYARELSGNLGMRQAVYDWAESGKPLYAECGGFMYLSEGIVGEDVGALPMAGVFPVTARMQKKRASLGYREVRLERDCFFGPVGTVLRGHEFHYSVIDAMPDHIARIYAVNNDSREGYRYKNVLGGYLHLHFGFNPRMAVEFVRFCRQGGEK